MLFKLCILTNNVNVSQYELVDLLRIGEYTLKNIICNFWIMQFLGETLSNFLIYIYKIMFEILEC